MTTIAINMLPASPPQQLAPRNLSDARPAPTSSTRPVAADPRDRDLQQPDDVQPGADAGPVQETPTEEPRTHARTNEANDSPHSEQAASSPAASSQPAENADSPQAGRAQAPDAAAAGLTQPQSAFQTILFAAAHATGSAPAPQGPELAAEATPAPIRTTAETPQQAADPWAALLGRQQQTQTAERSTAAPAGPRSPQGPHVVAESEAPAQTQQRAAVRAAPNNPTAAQAIAEPARAAESALAAEAGDTPRAGASSNTVAVRAGELAPTAVPQDRANAAGDRAGERPTGRTAQGGTRGFKPSVATQPDGQSDAPTPVRAADPAADRQQTGREAPEAFRQVAATATRPRAAGKGFQLSSGGPATGQAADAPAGEAPAAPSPAGGPAAPVATQAAGGPDAAGPASPTDQIAMQIRASADRFGGEITVRLNPPELGEVRIRLAADADGLRGTLEVENARTFEELQREAPALLNRLNAGGVSVRRLDVNFSGQSDSDGSAFTQLQDGDAGAPGGESGPRQDPADASETASATDEPAVEPDEAASGGPHEGTLNLWI